MSALDDPAFYYLANFRKALSWLSEQQRDLMNAEEQGFIDALVQLPLPAQALLVRLLMRKGVHFRLSKLRYAEIGCIEQAAAPLLAQGWLSEHVALSVDELGALLLKDELASTFAGQLPAQAVRKSQILDALSLSQLPAQRFEQWCPQLPDRVLSVTVAPLCERLRLMFFGNLSQDWSEFVLSDLGVYRYEPVAISAGSRGFNQRQDLDDYLHLRACREAFEAGTPVTEVLTQLGAFSSDNAHIHERHQRLLLRLAQQHERDSQWLDALWLYQRCGASGARVRHIRVCEQLGLDQQALALAEQALAAPHSAQEQQLAERARARLHKRLKLPAPAKAPPLHEPRIDLVLPQADCVELAAAEHFSSSEAPVYYVENSLICSLFSLLCWEAIFAPVPGAFFHPFHVGPVDLHRSDFYQRRADAFERCLSKLHDGRYHGAINATVAEKFGTQSPFVFWPLFAEPALLQHALTCIPAQHLEACFRRLLLNIRENRAGMPDLIQFWPEQKRYQMIEVKGPGDRLQDNQKRWLRFCAEQQMPVSVCYVQWQA